jgi:predicted nucleic acid-binding protein
MAVERVLFDSGIFLEVLLAQERAALCQTVIEEHQDLLAVTDFSLHAIGLVLQRHKRRDLYLEFFREMAPRVNVLTLPIERYESLLDYQDRYNLDFDDAYQLATASFFHLSFLTLDSDFNKAKENNEITILR